MPPSAKQSSGSPQFSRGAVPSSPSLAGRKGAISQPAMGIILDAVAQAFPELKPSSMLVVDSQGDTTQSVQLASYGDCGAPAVETSTLTPYMTSQLFDSYGQPIDGGPAQGDLARIFETTPGNPVLWGQPNRPVGRLPFVNTITAGPGTALDFIKYGLYDFTDAHGVVHPAPGHVDPVVNRPKGRVRTDDRTVRKNGNNDLESAFAAAGHLYVANKGIEFVAVPAPTTVVGASGGSGGGLTPSGVYQYAIGYTYGVADGQPAPTTTVTLGAAQNAGSISIPAATTAELAENPDGRVLYRTSAGGVVLYKVATVAGALNASASYSDTTADASLGGSAPTLPLQRINTHHLLDTNGNNVSGLRNDRGTDNRRLALWPDIASTQIGSDGTAVALPNQYQYVAGKTSADVISVAAPTSVVAPSAVAGSNLAIGDYVYAWGYMWFDGMTPPGPPATLHVTGSPSGASVVVPAGSTTNGPTGRVLYRTRAGGNFFYVLAVDTSAVGSPWTYTDTVLDDDHLPGPIAPVKNLLLVSAGSGGGSCPEFLTCNIDTSHSPSFAGNFGWGQLNIGNMAGADEATWASNWGDIGTGVAITNGEAGLVNLWYDPSIPQSGNIIAIGSPARKKGSGTVATPPLQWFLNSESNMSWQSNGFAFDIQTDSCVISARLDDAGHSVSGNLIELDGYTINLNGGGGDINFSGNVNGGRGTWDMSSVTQISGATLSGAQMTNTTMAGNVTMDNGVNIIVGTAAGTDIGTSSTQKIGFYGKTPVTQPTSHGAQTAGATWTTTEQNMLQDCYNALRNLGLIA